MLSLQLIRENTDLVVESLGKRGESPALAHQALELDAQHRHLLYEAESLRAQRNEANKKMATMKERPHELMHRHTQEMRSLGERLEALEAEQKRLEAELRGLLLTIPNLVDASVPEGLGEENNVVVRRWGEPNAFSFTPRPHWEIGEKLGILDFERGVKLSGSRFYVMVGAGARLQRALIQWMLDTHVQEHGYAEIYPPFLVKGYCLEGTGSLPKFSDNLYRDIEEDLWLVPTAEVPLTNLHRDEILPPGSLPLHYVAYTPCFRREKMSAGKDIRGIKRGHQFDKVELYKFTEPQDSDAEMEKLTADAEDLCRRLELPYRVVQLCSGELGFAATKSYDLEMWAPGCGEWLEVSSCSNCLDFQARRANVRYRPSAGTRPQFVHTLNGSGLALPRVVIAILENYQQADGSVVVPQVLRPYMVGLEVIRAK
ncbi:MAG: serine--tRNA ligase [Chloroflexi bacterium]|nr:serine--tRNA ligase [Chloroflexota bacterium]